MAAKDDQVRASAAFSGAKTVAFPLLPISAKGSSSHHPSAIFLSAQDFTETLHRPPLPRCKRLATDGCVYGIEAGEAVDICDAANGDGIADIQNLAIRIGERRPGGRPRPFGFPVVAKLTQ